MELINQVGEEIITPEELVKLMEEYELKKDFPICYDCEPRRLPFSTKTQSPTSPFCGEEIEDEARRDARPAPVAKPSARFASGWPLRIGESVEAPGRVGGGR